MIKVLLRGALLVCLLMGAGFAGSVGAQARPAAQPAPDLADFDMAAVIRAAANGKAGGMKIGVAHAVRQLDAILIADYDARGRISTESNARLKSLYSQAAHLMMNGHAIAGGTLVVIAWQEPAYARSACGPALAAFVQSMLAPIDEAGDVLGAYAVLAGKARGVLGKLPARLQMAAQLRVMGAIYRDDVAVEAGTQALRMLRASRAEMALVNAALKAGGTR
ncbi:MAG: hypothetical protein ABS98_11665 [Lysobacteraceae bacterium SCN 69-48]|nr:MAG: hypothetical protein ABS98_11665 [Xanthomonadaceae bacterium SCN 69-48]